MPPSTTPIPISPVRHLPVVIALLTSQWSNTCVSPPTTTDGGTRIPDVPGTLVEGSKVDEPAGVLREVRPGGVRIGLVLAAVVIEGAERTRREGSAIGTEIGAEIAVGLQNVLEKRVDAVAGDVSGRAPTDAVVVTDHYRIAVGVVGRDRARSVVRVRDRVRRVAPAGGRAAASPRSRRGRRRPPRSCACLSRTLARPAT